MRFRHVLADARKVAGLDQESLGKRLGVSQPVISRWENGGPVDPKYLDVIADFLQMEHDELVLLVYGKDGAPSITRRLDALEDELRDLSALVRSRLQGEPR